VEYEVLANRMGFTSDLYLTLLITALGQRRSAVAAIEPGMFGNGFHFAQEVIFGIALLNHASGNAFEVTPCTNPY
jgi:hypothetical protein